MFSSSSLFDSISPILIQKALFLLQMAFFILIFITQENNIFEIVIKNNLMSKQKSPKTNSNETPKTIYFKKTGSLRASITSLNSIDKLLAEAGSSRIVDIYKCDSIKTEV